MKIFQSIQQYFTILGITEKQTRERSSLSLKHLTILLLMFSCVVTNAVCIVHVAETFEEYTLCIYGFFTFGMTVLEFAIHIWKLKPIFKFIGNFEQLIESSELNYDY